MTFLLIDIFFAFLKAENNSFSLVTLFIPDFPTIEIEGLTTTG